LTRDADKAQSQLQHSLEAARDDGACELTLDDPLYSTWHEASQGQWLLILGEMGHGKTVLMSHIIKRLGQENDQRMPQPQTCFYYCKNESTVLSADVFSALILSLLSMSPLRGLKKTFVNWHRSRQAAGTRDPTRSSGELALFLEQVLPSLQRPVCFVIDGLDECDRQTRKQLVDTLKRVSNKSSRIKVLLSARPDDEIIRQLSEVPQLKMKTSIVRDEIIVRHHVDKLDHLSDEVRSMMVATLSPLVSGSAIWVTMVIKLIELKEIRAKGSMERFLKEITLPEDLAGLYDQIIHRLAGGDKDNISIIIAALGIVSASRRPMTILELAWAVALAVPPYKIGSIAELADAVDHERVIKLIYPFISTIDHQSLEQRQIRLTHQSVKEFVVPKWSDWRNSVYQPPLAILREDTTNDFMFEVCGAYLLLDDVNTIPLLSDELNALLELPGDIDLSEDPDSARSSIHSTWEEYEKAMDRYDPADRQLGHFFGYAGSHWLEHFGTVRNMTEDRLAKIELLCETGSCRIDNWINQYRRPNCTVVPRFEFPSHMYDPLSITALYGSDEAFSKLLAISDFGSMPPYLPSPVIKTADQILIWGDLSKQNHWGDLSRLKELFFTRTLSDNELRSLDFFLLVLRQWAELNYRHDNWDVAFDLVSAVVDDMILGAWGRQLLCSAAKIGCKPVVDRLVDAAATNNLLHHELLYGVASVSEAVRGDRVDVLHVLLGDPASDFGAHARHVNSASETVLHVAARWCNPDVYALLLQHVSLDTCMVQDRNGYTPLMRIVGSDTELEGRYRCVEMLLDFIRNRVVHSQTTPTPQDTEALRMATSAEDSEMCRLLLTARS
jgi:hypothetical protein